VCETIRIPTLVRISSSRGGIQRQPGYNLAVYSRGKSVRHSVDEAGSGVLSCGGERNTSVPGGNYNSAARCLNWLSHTILPSPPKHNYERFRLIVTKSITYTV
jgi:hypothetical protein